MFMTPELRSAILSLPLCDRSLESFASWLPEGQKREILMALQELFVKLQEVNENCLFTRNLTDSFHWNGEEVVQQHDVQELNRVLFDAIERALQGTDYYDLIGKLYKGMYINETLCLNCRTLKEREDAFCDISLEVKNCESIYESFMQLIAKNKLEGRDQYFCETCNKKVDAEIGTRIQQLPPILTLSLKRFEYDTKTWERVKLTKNYEYPLELDLSEFVHEEAKYELFAVIIHAGTAHSGHYHAYIRDLLKSGKWEPIAKLAEEPKAEIPPDSDSESAHRPKKSRKNKNHQAVTTETIAPNPSEAPKQNLDYEDFPNSCHNPGLLNDWYDFNDSSVTPIKSGKLIKQYGGSHETGYMLIYRNVKLNSNLSLTEIPDYWKTPIRSLNEAHEKHREQYEELKNWIEIQLQDVSLFDYSDGLLKYVLPEKALDQGVSLKIKMTDTVSDLLVNLKLQLENSHPCITEYEFIEARPLSSKYVHLLRKIQDLDPSLLLKDSKFYHKMCLVIVPVIHESELLRSATSYIGEEFEPITINCNILGEKSLIAVNKGWTLENLSSKIMEVSGIPPSLQILKLLKPQGDTREFTDNDLPKTLIELKFYHSAQLSVNMKEDFDEIIEEKKPEVSQDMVTVLVNDENDVNNVIQHFVSIDWKVKDLLEEMKSLFKIDKETPVRIRKLNEDVFFYKEEINNKLRSVPEFEEGGYRINIERGEAPSMGQIVLRVALDQNDIPKEVFCDPKDKITDLKPRIGEVLGVDMTGYKLYRTDWLREPISALKIEDQNLHKALVRDGDLLIARTNDTVLATEMVKIFVFVTKTGAPDDCEFLDEISAPEDSTLLQLKSQLLSLPKVNELNLTPSHLRLRERTKTLWFGKVFREDHKTIKKQNISFGYNLVVQVLPEPETLTQNGIFLYVCERKVNEKTRGELHEAYFDPQSTPNIDHLYEFALETLQKDWKTSDLTLAKYRNHLFDWEIIKDDRRPEERGTLMISKPNNNLKGIYNLKKAPVLLKEGDLIAVKHNLDDTNNIDDFSCEIDQYLKENYKKNKPGEGKKAPRKVKPERGIKIADF